MKEKKHPDRKGPGEAIGRPTAEVSIRNKRWPDSADEQFCKKISIFVNRKKCERRTHAKGSSGRLCVAKIIGLNDVNSTFAIVTNEDFSS
ncbi:hypothetical protein [Paraburkholderia domus]|jgi:hypothetical protein|uniref:hypothetical protein n=1 Tax=Paraburkholderia domus TaxID=2793075 RepID=UPI0019112ADE|nr:hypothetical protein [Paraburkholderia domus]MBK5066292.1 hypothetical protein [Burkholderia sp. R-70199]MCI0151389.1 hypothetical protein [Paraburkholderia sediminicola]